MKIIIQIDDHDYSFVVCEEMYDGSKRSITPCCDMLKTIRKKIREIKEESVKKTNKATHIVACESARFKGVKGEFGRVAIPCSEERIGEEEAYLKKHYDCKSPIVITKLIREGDDVKSNG